MSAPTKTDRDPLVGRLFAAVTALANVAATLWIIALMLLVVADVAGRNLLLIPIAGVPEIVKFSIVGIVFLQIAHTHAHGRMIRSDGLINLLWRRRPGVARVLEFLAQMTGFGLTLTLAWAVVPRLQKAWERGEFEGAIGHFVLPVWPFLAIVIAGSVLLGLSFLAAAWRAATGPAQNQDEDRPWSR